MPGRRRAGKIGARRHTRHMADFLQSAPGSARLVRRGTPTDWTSPAATLPQPTDGTGGVDLTTVTAVRVPTWQVAIESVPGATITNLSASLYVTAETKWERITAPGSPVLFSSLTIPANGRFVLIVDDVDSGQDRLALVADGVSADVRYRATPLIAGG